MLSARRKLQMLLLFAILTNLLTLLYLSHMQTEECILADDHGKILAGAINGNAKFEKGVTVVIRDFEQYDTAVVETAERMLELEQVRQIVIVSDKLPYPPLAIPESKRIKLVILHAQPDQLYNTSQPGSYIQTTHVLLLPDGVKLVTNSDTVASVSMQRVMSATQTDLDDRVKMVAWPIDTYTAVHCMTMNVNLTLWTLSYYHAKDKTICDAVHGQFVVLMQTSDLLQLASPFTAPIHTSLFIQSALRKWKVRLNNLPIFQHFRMLYSDPHNNWKHQSDEYGRLKRMYQQFGIKLVVRPSGQEEWHGCEKDTDRCFGTVLGDMPEYLNEGRWTPPCCLRNLRVTARHVFSVLEKAGVRYWLEGGSLLGAARTEDIIPWDYDVDIGVYKEDFSKSTELTNCETQPYEDEQGFVWERASEGDFCRVQYSSTNHLHVDIFPFYSRNAIMTKDTWFKNHKQDTEFPEHYVKPFVKLKFAGVEAFAPNNWKDFLELKFGKGVIENPRYPNGKTLV